MGKGMALNLLQQHNALFVYDTNQDALATLSGAGADICSSPQEMASRCDVVFLCLPFSPQVRDVVFGDHGLTSAGRTSLTVIDTTTLDRSDAIDIGAAAEESSIIYADCPVSGMPFRADDGTLTVMFGGSPGLFERVKPYLSSFGDDVRHCGSLGSGQAMKAINNVIYNINIVALCELLPLATAVGLDPEEVASVVTSASSRSFASEYFVPRMLERRFDTDFAMRDAYKDIVNVQKMGVDTKAMLPVVNAMIASYQSAIANGFGSEPKSAIIKIYEEALGVKFEKAEAS